MEENLEDNSHKSGDEIVQPMLDKKNQPSTPTSTTIPKYLKINYACMCFFAFLTGTDFAVIIPTLWDRLNQNFGAGGTFMGLVMSSYSLSGVICGLIMGKLSDEINKTKMFYLISIIFGIVGHLMYFVGVNKYVLLFARAVSGISLGCTSVVLASIAKTTTDKQRTGVISLVMASRQFGLMFGPAFNLFLRRMNFTLFDMFQVDRKSSPGLFMAVLWLLCLFIVLVFFTENKKSTPKDENQAKITGKLSREVYRKQFVRFEIFILLAVTFFTYFNQTSLETMVIPFTELMFGWNELHNSILFCVGGFIIILSYVLIRMLTLKLNDRAILLMGISSIFLGLIIACTCLPFAKQLQSVRVISYKSKYSFGMGSNKLNSPLIIESNSTLTNSTNTTSESKTYDYQFFPAFVVFVVRFLINFVLKGIILSLN
jgi:ceroid-lipofuscinosis MFS transporter 7